MERTESGVLETDSVPRLGWLAVGLALVTGVIHLYAGVVEGRIPVALAGVGFFGAVALYLADYRRRLLYLGGVVYTAVQIPLWYVANAGAYTTVGYADKVVQAALVVLLAYLYWQARVGQSPDERADAAETGQAP